MKSAAASLVPVTLELGGKNPTIVGPDKVTEPLTIAQIAGVKSIKRGQLCVTVDYCLVPASGLEAFTEALVAPWAGACMPGQQVRSCSSADCSVDSNAADEDYFE